MRWRWKVDCAVEKLCAALLRANWLHSTGNKSQLVSAGMTWNALSIQSKLDFRRCDARKCAAAYVGIESSAIYFAPLIPGPSEKNCWFSAGWKAKTTVHKRKAVDFCVLFHRLCGAQAIFISRVRLYGRSQKKTIAVNVGHFSRFSAFSTSNIRSSCP